MRVNCECHRRRRRTMYAIFIAFSAAGGRNEIIKSQQHSVAIKNERKNTPFALCA